MKLYKKTRKLFTLLTAVLIVFACLASEGIAVTANAATKNSTYVHLVTGKLRDQTIGVYTGDMVDGVPHGKGTIEYAFGASFEGTFQNGEINGYGTYYYEEGTYIDGDWSWGTATSSLDSERSGSKLTYSGMFCDGEACGFGELALENCGTFYGEFFDGNVDGWGVYAYQTPVPEDEPLIDGRDWEMVWGSKKHDHTYNGLSLSGKWQGFGLGVMNSGSHYVGEIRNEYRQGYGRLYLAGNKLYQEGTFRAGSLVKSTQSEQEPSASTYEDYEREWGNIIDSGKDSTSGNSGSSGKSNTSGSSTVGGDCDHCGGSGICLDCALGDCNYCFGEGTEDCSRCFGSGDCQSCYGTTGEYRGYGDNFGWRDCSSCRATGNCSRCKGSGTKDCSYCYGSGNCRSCNGTEICPYC